MMADFNDFAIWVNNTKETPPVHTVSNAVQGGSCRSGGGMGGPVNFRVSCSIFGSSNVQHTSIGFLLFYLP